MKYRTFRKIRDIFYTRGGELLPCRKRASFSLSSTIKISFHSVPQQVIPFPYLPLTVTAAIKKTICMYVHICIRRECRGRDTLNAQWRDRCSGGDSASDRESGGKGRQLATSVLHCQVVSLLTSCVSSTSDVSSQNVLRAWDK